MLKDDFSLPASIEALIENKEKDFSVKASYRQPIKESLKFIIFGVVFMFISWSIWFAILEIDTDIISRIFVIVFMLVFIWSGTIVLWRYGIYPAFKKGWYFIGTAKELLHYHDQKLESIPWSRIAGNIEIRSSSKNQRGSITLQLKNNEQDGLNHELDADFISIQDIPNVIEIAKLCLQRINENKKSI